MYRFVPVLLILALALGACGHKKTPAPAASSSSVTADALIYNSAHSDIAMDKWLACARFVQGTEMSGGMGALKCGHRAESGRGVHLPNKRRQIPSPLGDPAAHP